MSERQADQLSARPGHRGPPLPGRRDRAGRILFAVIVAAIIVPVIWLVVISAAQGPDGVDRTPRTDIPTGPRLDP